MRAVGLPQFTLEAHRPVAAFDVLGVSFATELGYTNLLNALDLAGMALRSAERDEGDPLVIAGGHAAFNPEPVADFLDAAVLGDGEEAALLISDLIKGWKATGRPGGREGLLLRLAATGSVYVPRFYDVSYAADGAIAAVLPEPRRRPGPGPQAHPDGPGRLAVPEEAAGPPGGDGARALLGGDLPGLHPRLPVLPGRHDHPAGAGTQHRRHRSDGAGRHRGDRSGGGRAAQPVQRRPLRDRTGDQAARRPLRGHERVAVAAEHPGGRVQRRPGQRVVPQRPTVGADLRPRGRLGAAPPGDQQDGQRGRPHRHRRRRLLALAGGR